MRRPAGDAALRLIILYKLVKGGCGLALALLLLGLALSDGGAELADAVSRHIHHLTHPWAQHLGDALVRVLRGRYLFAVAGALALDGTFTMLEGWALARGAVWGHWLVVVSTSLLMPPELVALFRHASAVRALILVLNVAIVAYLVRHARDARDMRKRAR